MALQYDTKVLANVGLNAAGTSAGLTGGNQGYTGKYYPYEYFVTGTPAAITNSPIGAAPCPCTYIGVQSGLAAGTGGTLAVTVSPKIIPYDTGTAAALNTTDQIFGTPIATFPAFTSSVNFDGSGVKTQHGQSGTNTGTGITDAVLKTGTSAAFRQGDWVALSTSGTFTGGGGLSVVVWLKEQNGAF